MPKSLTLFIDQNVQVISLLIHQNLQMILSFSLYWSECQNDSISLILTACSNDYLLLVIHDNVQVILSSYRSECSKDSLFLFLSLQTRDFKWFSLSVFFDENVQVILLTSMYKWFSFPIYLLVWMPKWLSCSNDKHVQMILSSSLFWLESSSDSLFLVTSMFK